MWSSDLGSWILETFFLHEKSPFYQPLANPWSIQAARSQRKQTDAKSPRPQPLAVSSVHKSVSGIEYSDEDDGKEIHPAHLAATESQEVREMESSEIVWTVCSTRQYHAFRRYWNESSPEKETGPMEVDVAKQSDDDPSEA